MAMLVREPGDMTNRTNYGVAAVVSVAKEAGEDGLSTGMSLCVEAVVLTAAFHTIVIHPTCVQNYLFIHLFLYSCLLASFPYIPHTFTLHGLLFSIPQTVI